MTMSDSDNRRTGHIEGPSMGSLIAIFVFVVVVIAAFIILRPMARQPGYVESSRPAVTSNTSAGTTTDAVGQASPQVAPAPQATPGR
jgi:hypothetical protein